jgi:hypothetical protein
MIALTQRLASKILSQDLVSIGCGTAVVIQVFSHCTRQAGAKRRGDMASAILLEHPQYQMRLLGEIIGRDWAKQCCDAARTIEQAALQAADVQPPVDTIWNRRIQ